MNILLSHHFQFVRHFSNFYSSIVSIYFPHSPIISTIFVSTHLMVGWWGWSLLGVSAVTPAPSSVLLLSVVLHVLLRVVHVGSVVLLLLLLLLLLVVLELVWVNCLGGLTTSSVVVVAAGNGPSSHGRGGRSSVGVLFAPGALCNLTGDLGSVHGHDGAAGGLLVVESHEGVALVAEEPERQ